MKTYIQIIIALLAIIPISTLANTSSENRIEMQCKKIVYEEGSNDEYMDGFLAGIMEGISFLVPKEEIEEFAKDTPKFVIEYKACKNALSNVSKHRFQLKYKLELLKIISTKY